ncbi:MAG TPA: MoaD/ThiS family protein [Nocardioidaceae bacterium]|nr:MoaD/ThiS family protein [Nocardioidaceae bacterium]
MQVTVTRRGRLARPGSGYVETLTLAEDAVASDVPTAVGIDPRTCIVVVNGVAVPRGTALHEGDRTQLYPAQAGG